VNICVCARVCVCVCAFVGVIIVCKRTTNLEFRTFLTAEGGGGDPRGPCATVCARALSRLPVVTRSCTALQTGTITHNQQITRLIY
jgi:hypothetical protein